MKKDIVSSRYLNGKYAEQNPDWDSADSPWKAVRVVELFKRHNLFPKSIVEVGCGSGGVLAALRGEFPDASLAGYDIAPGAAKLWPHHDAANIQFTVGDFLAANQNVVDVVLMLDVLEHLSDPFSYLDRLRAHGRYMVFHIPLDLSALSVLRESPLLHVREKVGHIHYFTRGLAIALLEDCGYRVIDASYTGAAFTAPQRTWAARLADPARRLAYALSRDWGVRLLGGETLMVLACPGATP